MKRIGILGSTGSIGTSALDVVRDNRDKFTIDFLTCGKNINYLSAQIIEFLPRRVVVESEEDAKQLKKQFHGLDIYYGTQGLLEVARYGEADLLLNALVGIMGFSPTLEAIYSGKNIALANKETLVAGGSLVMKAAEEKSVTLLPVDSEHSAIFQALQGNEGQEISRIILTASGGPFRGYSKEQLENVTVEEALKHPNWTMGKKVTIDSATMMNKGLEVIEAKWLFGSDPEKIQVVVHRESIIHSMVEYKDKSVMAQLSVPDMRLPISYAFSYPERIENFQKGIDFIELGQLHFESVDMEVFGCLKLAYDAIKQGNSYPLVLNAANEVLVEQFLNKDISFTDIQKGVEKALNEHLPSEIKEAEEVLEIDRNTREKVKSWVLQR